MRLPFTIPPPEAKPFDIVGFGLNSIDLLAVVAEFPTTNTKQRLQRFARLPGGQIATAAVACARLGWRARYIGSFGDDPFGKESEQSLRDQHVDLTAARVVTGATNQFAVILVDARSGDRTVLWDRDPALVWPPEELPADALISGRLLLVDCQETAASARAARLAREAGVPTIIDVEKVRPGIAELLQHIDAIIAAQEFPAAFTGHEQIGRAIRIMARELGAPLVCVTLGHEGSLAFCGGREIRTPAFPVDCVDTTGAGDAFRGGFAAACLESEAAAGGCRELEDILAFANAVAALNCRGLGARGGLPTRADVDRLLGRM